MCIGVVFSCEALLAYWARERPLSSVFPHVPRKMGWSVCSIGTHMTAKSFVAIGTASTAALLVFFT